MNDWELLRKLRLAFLKQAVANGETLVSAVKRLGYKELLK